MTSVMVVRRRLGHIAHMPEHYMPKAMLFGWLCNYKPRPRSGHRRSTIQKDLKLLKLMRVNGTRKRQHQEKHGEQFVQITHVMTTKVPIMMM